MRSGCVSVGDLEVAGRWTADAVVFTQSRDRGRRADGGAGVGSHGPKYEFPPLISQSIDKDIAMLPLRCTRHRLLLIRAVQYLLLPAGYRPDPTEGSIAREGATEHDLELATVVAMHFKGTQITAAGSPGLARVGVTGMSHRWRELEPRGFTVIPTGVA